MSHEEQEQDFPYLLEPEDGGITEKLVQVLEEVFERFANKQSALSRDALNQFSRVTNDQEMTDETYEEIKEAFDVTDDGQLTLKGFIQLYSLQTESDPEETIKDLKKLGYDEKLEKIQS